MITLRHSLETISLIALGSVAAFFVMMQQNNYRSQRVFSASIPEVITPIQNEITKGPQISVMDSPEGSKILTLEVLKGKETSTYSLSTSLASGIEKKVVFKKEKPVAHELSIPFNTWSTDNAYVFLKEKTPQIENYLVFKSNGELFPNDTTHLSIQELFTEKVKGYAIVDVTGWAGPTSLIVNAKATEGDGRVSFWFEVPSQSFIQLGTYFN